MKESSSKPKLENSGQNWTKAEKCGICFFIDNKPIFTLVRTRNQKFNRDLMEETYFKK